MRTTFSITEHSCDLCVVGGGLAGTIAALSAARGGMKVVLIQDRPMLGG
ncbi:MAG: FAD-dependent oxidoreductase, partial [Clostridia bacterium]|nr:FAD-dependent oxidoreductase [Clostridia bacterium]